MLTNPYTGGFVEPRDVVRNVKIPVVTETRFKPNLTRRISITILTALALPVATLYPTDL